MYKYINICIIYKYKYTKGVVFHIFINTFIYVDLNIYLVSSRLLTSNTPIFPRTTACEVNWLKVTQLDFYA